MPPFKSANFADPPVAPAPNRIADSRAGSPIFSELSRSPQGTPCASPCPAYGLLPSSESHGFQGGCGSGSRLLPQLTRRDFGEAKDNLKDVAPCARIIAASSAPAQKVLHLSVRCIRDLFCCPSRAREVAVSSSFLIWLRPLCIPASERQIHNGYQGLRFASVQEDTWQNQQPKQKQKRIARS